MTLLNSKGIKQKCVNGDISQYGPGGNIRCLCEKFWKNSGFIDLNGYPFKCDIVNEDAAGIFYNQLTTDGEGNIIKYGQYTP